MDYVVCAFKGDGINNVSTGTVTLLLMGNLRHAYTALSYFTYMRTGAGTSLIEV